MDPAKDAENRRKHGYRLEDGIDVLEDPNHVFWYDDRFDYDELREATVGLGKSEILLVISVVREQDVTRIISVRKANRNERYRYYYGRP